MPHYLQRPFFLSFVFSILAASLTFGQTPTPINLQSFPLPLSDGTTGTAVFLPMPDGSAYLVVTTTTGKVGFWTLTQTNPTPPPDPVPPTPLPDDKLTLVIVEDPVKTTAQQRALLSDDAWRDFVSAKHSLIGIIPNDVKDAKTGQRPPVLAPFLGLADGQPLPWIMLYNSKGKLVYQGPLPDSSEEIISLIHRFSSR